VPARPEPPDQLGPYRILRRLGQGGMGTVYDARDIALERHVALKLIAPGLADDPEFRARFVREARAQASVDSPHVVQVFAHGELQGQLYLATQLVPDGDLGRHLRQHGPLPAARALELVAQVADGLAEAHRVGLMHCDIKPTNVLLRHRGTGTVAYLADFGIAGPLAGTGVADDVRALARLLELAAGGRSDPAVRQVLDAFHDSAAAFRDGARRATRRPARSGARWATAAAGALVGALCLGAAILVPALSGRPGERAREGAAISALARALEDDAGLDPRDAVCTARELVVGRGVDGLRSLGLLDQQLQPVPSGDAVAPDLLAESLAVAVTCLWDGPPVQTASRGAPAAPPVRPAASPTAR